METENIASNLASKSQGLETKVDMSMEIHNLDNDCKVNQIPTASAIASVTTDALKDYQMISECTSAISHNTHDTVEEPIISGRHDSSIVKDEDQTQMQVDSLVDTAADLSTAKEAGTPSVVSRKSESQSADDANTLDHAKVSDPQSLPDVKPQKTTKDMGQSSSKTAQRKSESEPQDHFEIGKTVAAFLPIPKVDEAELKSGRRAKRESCYTVVIKSFDKVSKLYTVRDLDPDPDNEVPTTWKVSSDKIVDFRQNKILKPFKKGDKVYALYRESPDDELTTEFYKAKVVKVTEKYITVNYVDGDNSVHMGFDEMFIDPERPSWDTLKKAERQQDQKSSSSSPTVPPKKMKENIFDSGKKLKENIIDSGKKLQTNIKRKFSSSNTSEVADSSMSTSEEIAHTQLKHEEKLKQRIGSGLKETKVKIVKRQKVETGQSWEKSLPTNRKTGKAEVSTSPAIATEKINKEQRRSSVQGRLRNG
ncbi:hypothetical protein BJ742DRAFT_568208 [Cladochytrium replicatum]|nr:hypothetical protein BJ742DRAFT_568208 [Cladochytrium replicatum]